MKRYALAIAALLAWPALAQQRVPELRFTSVPDYPNLPAGMNFGEVSGVAVNSRGHVFVFTRSNSATGPAYGPRRRSCSSSARTGEFVREIGKGLYGWSFAHTVRIDKDDNIWAVDKGSDMVIKFNQAGRVVWVFGAQGESADDEAEPWEHPDPPLPPVDGLFRQPTDVAWDSEGNIYITDGYVNSRVAKYDKNGDWVKSWGDAGHRARPVQHSARDRHRPQQQRLCRRSLEPAHPGVRHRRQASCACSPIDVPPAPGTRPGQRQHADRRAARRARSARPTRSASRRARTRCCSSARARFPGACSRCRSTARCSASSAGRGAT